MPFYKAPASSSASSSSSVSSSLSSRSSPSSEDVRRPRPSYALNGVVSPLVGTAVIAARSAGPSSATPTITITSAVHSPRRNNTHVEDNRGAGSFYGESQEESIVEREIREQKAREAEFISLHNSISSTTSRSTQDQEKSPLSVSVSIRQNTDTNNRNRDHDVTDDGHFPAIGLPQPRSDGKKKVGQIVSSGPTIIGSPEVNESAPRNSALDSSVRSDIERQIVPNISYEEAISTQAHSGETLIAKEIREFKEREEELKRRLTSQFVDNGTHHSAATDNNGGRGHSGEHNESKTSSTTSTLSRLSSSSSGALVDKDYTGLASVLKASIQNKSALFGSAPKTDKIERDKSPAKINSQGRVNSDLQRSSADVSIRKPSTNNPAATTIRLVSKESPFQSSSFMSSVPNIGLSRKKDSKRLEDEDPVIAGKSVGSLSISALSDEPHEDMTRLDDTFSKRTSWFVPQQDETPIQKEVRMARERENALRIARGLPVVNLGRENERNGEEWGEKSNDGNGSKRVVEVRLESNGSSQKGRDSTDLESTMKKLSSSRLMMEILKEEQREIELRGGIKGSVSVGNQTSKISENEVSSEKLDQKQTLLSHQHEFSDANQGRTSKRAVANRDTWWLEKSINTGPQHNGDSHTLGPGTESDADTGSSLVRSTNSIIEQEVREMQRREEELRQQRFEIQHRFF